MQKQIIFDFFFMNDEISKIRWVLKLKFGKIPIFIQFLFLLGIVKQDSTNYVREFTILQFCKLFVRFRFLILYNTHLMKQNLTKY